MNIRTLFDAYEQQVTHHPDSEAIFAGSGMVNRRNELGYGFFPLGAGVFTRENITPAEAEVPPGGIMFLGNDFGTVGYVETGCKDGREHNSPTIRQLLSLNPDLSRCFFTNFYLGLRNDKANTGATMTKRAVAVTPDYRDLCFGFFLTQLKMIDPALVVCLGAEVGETLSGYSAAFAGFSKKAGAMSKLYAAEGRPGYLVRTDDDQFGQRSFLLIPHPSYAHINWQKNEVRRKITEALTTAG